VGGISTERVERLAVAFDLLNPTLEHRIGSLFDVEELDAHADLGLDGAHDGQSFDFLILADHGDADTRFQAERLASANEASPE